jgi:hypothetical protein
MALRQEITFVGDFKSVAKQARNAAADIAKRLESGFTRTLSRLQTIQSGIGRVGKRLADGVGAGLRDSLQGANLAGLIGAAAAPIAAGLSSVTDEIGAIIGKADSLSKLRVLDPVTYQRLAIAAGKVDANIGDVEKATLSLNKSLNATELPKNFAKALDAAGISAEQLKALKPEEQFRLIADAVAAVPDPAQQAALSVQLLGASGAKLAPLLKQGGDAIKALGDTAQAQGRIINQESIDAAAAINDSLDSMKEPLEGLKTTLLSQILPPISKVLGALAGFLTDNAAAIKEGISVVADSIGTAVHFVVRVVSLLQPLFETTVEVVGRVIESLQGVFASLRGGEGVWTTLITTLADALIPIITFLGDTLIWLIDLVVGPAIVVLSEFAELISNVITLFTGASETASTFGTVLTTVQEVFSATGKVIRDIIANTFDRLVGTLRLIISLFNTFTTGTWEDAFVSLGNALLSFILEPLRSIVSTVVTIADAISEDLVPESVRAFAQGGAIQALAREAREAPIVVPQATITEDAKAAAELIAESPAYGPIAPKGAGKTKGPPKLGKGKGASKAGKEGGAVIEIPARGITFAFTPPASTPTPATPTLQIPQAPTATALAALTGASGGGGITIGDVHVDVQINGANVDSTPSTLRTLKRTTEQAVLAALNRANASLSGRKQT